MEGRHRWSQSMFEPCAADAYDAHGGCCDSDADPVRHRAYTDERRKSGTCPSLAPSHFKDRYEQQRTARTRPHSRGGRTPFCLRRCAHDAVSRFDYGARVRHQAKRVLRTNDPLGGQRYCRRSNRTLMGSGQLIQRQRELHSCSIPDPEMRRIRNAY